MSQDARIPWWQPRIGSEEGTRVLAVLDSEFINDGDVTSEFERRLAALAGCRHAVAVTSGTAALYLSLKAVGIGPGDEVVVPDLTFIASANAVTMAGARGYRPPAGPLVGGAGQVVRADPAAQRDVVAVAL